MKRKKLKNNFNRYKKQRHFASVFLYAGLNILFDDNYTVAVKRKFNLEAVLVLGNGYGRCGARKRVVKLCGVEVFKRARDICGGVFGIDEEITLFTARFLAKADNTLVRSIKINGEAFIETVKGGDESRCGGEF